MFFLDYLLFSVVLIALHINQEKSRRNMLRAALQGAKDDMPGGDFLSRRLPFLTSGALALIIGIGLLFINYQFYKNKEANAEAHYRVGTVMAREFEIMAYSGRRAQASDPTIRPDKIVRLEKFLTELIKFDNSILRIYTLEKLPDGTVETGLGPFGREGLANEDFDQSLFSNSGKAEIDRVFAGERPFLRNGSCANTLKQFCRILIPLRLPDGSIHAIMGVEFDSSEARSGMIIERYVVMGILFLMFLLLNASAWAIFQRRLDLLVQKKFNAELIESEQRFRILANHAPVLLHVADPIAYYYFFNETWLNFVGAPLKSQLGSGWIDYVHPEDVPAVKEAMAAAFHNREVLTTEFRLKHHSRDYCWMMATYVPRWQDKIFAGFMGSCVDITAHKQIEQTLEYQVEFEKIVATISANFVNIANAEIDKAITRALGEIGRFAGVDRCYVFIMTADMAEIGVTHEWCAEDIACVENNMGVINAADFEWLLELLKTKGECHIPRVDDIPDSFASARDFFCGHGVKSVLCVPMLYGSKLHGFISLESLRREKNWAEEHIYLLRLVGEVLTSALQRRLAQIALHKSEAKNKAILNAVPDIMYQVKRDGLIVDYKPPKHSQSSGLTEAAFGGNVSSLLPGHLIKPGLDAIETALDTGEVQVFEYYHTIANKTEYFEARITKAGDDEVLMMVRDISERRRSEACDLLSLDIAMKVLEEQPLEEIYAFAGQQLMSIFGLRLLWISRKESEGGIKMFTPTEEAAAFLQGITVRWDDSPEGQGPTGIAIRTGKFQIVAVDELEMPLWREALAKRSIVSGAAFPLKVGGNILGALTIYTSEKDFWTKRTIVHLTNFAEHIALAVNATADRQRLKLLTTGLESAANAIIITDWEGRIQWVNPAFLKLTGFSAAEAMFKNVQDLESKRHSRAFYKAMRRLILSGRIWHGEMISRRRDGRLFTAEMTITPVRDETGQIANFIAIIQDVTQRKQAEREMMEAREAVTRAERLSSLGIMAAGIAHEINQPLNSLKVMADGMLYWYKQGKVPELDRVMENLQKISKQADRIDSIIKHMRSFVRSSQAAEPSPCDINAVVNESLSLVGTQLATHCIEIRTDLGEALPPIMANNTQLEEVVINLLVNAMQSLDTVDKPEKWINIVTSCHKDEVVLEVMDNGPGISKKIKSKIFEPFFTTKTTGEGMGLGLSIVHSIITSYGGQISIKSSKPGEGAIFRIEFPVYPDKEKGAGQL